MKFNHIFATALLLTVSAAALQAQPNRGYYKDIFMDSGIRLNATTSLPAARSLGYSIETFVASPKNFTTIDTLLQSRVFEGSPMDENGHLLYPDGAPRFRVIYMNGGRALSHVKSLGEKGRQNYRDFVKGGGSYIGTCAGAYCASVGWLQHDTVKHIKEYLGIWPGCTGDTDLFENKTDMAISEDSPLLKYYDFGGNMTVEDVRHNGGCYACEDLIWPENTEVLARYSTAGRKDVKPVVDGKPSIWASKESAATGRVISCGSHPEVIPGGERFYLMRAMVQYALDGNGCPKSKGALLDGETRRMTKATHDNDPDYTRIGDKQYHHFTYDVPEGCDSVVIRLEALKGFEDYDLYLYADNNGFAFCDNAWYRNVDFGVGKDLVIENPKSGKLYISVFCDTTVDVENTAYGEQYSGRIDVLNGVPYMITVNPTGK